MQTSITPVTDGQKSELGNVVGDAARKGARMMVDELVKRGVLSGEDFQKVLAQGNAIAAAALDAARMKIAELAESIVGRLRLISGAQTITIPACKGKRTIAQSADVFTWGIDGDFVRWGLDVPGEETPATDMEVHEMVKDGTFKEIFGGTGHDLDKLVLTQDQIVTFVESHKKWLRTDGYGTFFLTKRGDDLFVVYVYLRSVLRPDVYVYEFAHGVVWRAEGRRRFVIPQLVA